MRNFVKSILLLLMAIWLFRFAGGTLPSLANIPTHLPSGNEVVSLATEILARLSPVSENSTAIVDNANRYNGLKLRTTPSQTGIIIDALPDGTSVRVIRYSADKNWAFVETVLRQNKGWVFADYLSRQP